MHNTTTSNRGTQRTTENGRRKSLGGFLSKIGRLFNANSAAPKRVQSTATRHPHPSDSTPLPPSQPVTSNDGIEVELRSTHSTDTFTSRSRFDNDNDNDSISIASSSSYFNPEGRDRNRNGSHSVNLSVEYPSGRRRRRRRGKKGGTRFVNRFPRAFRQRRETETTKPNFSTQNASSSRPNAARDPSIQSKDNSSAASAFLEESIPGNIPSPMPHQPFLSPNTQMPPNRVVSFTPDVPQQASPMTTSFSNFPQPVSSSGASIMSAASIHNPESYTFRNSSLGNRPPSIASTTNTSLRYYGTGPRSIHSQYNNIIGSNPAQGASAGGGAGGASNSIYTQHFHPSADNASIRGIPPATIIERAEKERERDRKGYGNGGGINDVFSVVSVRTALSFGEKSGVAGTLDSRSVWSVGSG
ncbi:hypothetical protein BJ741DRAFT_637024 [Chytriomyces cf. hyalinus JEL632]|nr:hypothetical protein BJ741DRAFT_637024 [Chytriomyces cf. hyalinus JEL632]